MRRQRAFRPALSDTLEGRIALSSAAAAAGHQAAVDARRSQAADVQSATTTPTSPSYEELTTTYANGDAGNIVGVGTIHGTTQTEYRLTVPTSSDTTTTSESINLAGGAGLEKVVNVATKQGNTTTENITTTLPNGSIDDQDRNTGYRWPQDQDRRMAHHTWRGNSDHRRHHRSKRAESDYHRGNPYRRRQGVPLSPGRHPIQSARIQHEQHDHGTRWRGHKRGQVEHDDRSATAAVDLTSNRTHRRPPRGADPFPRMGSVSAQAAAFVVNGNQDPSIERSPAHVAAGEKVGSCLAGNSQEGSDRIVVTHSSDLSQSETNTTLGPGGSISTVKSTTSTVLNPNEVGQSAALANLSLPAPTGTVQALNLQAQVLTPSSVIDGDPSPLPILLPEPSALTLMAIVFGGTVLRRGWTRLTSRKSRTILGFAAIESPIG